MTLKNPFPGHTALATFADVRRDLEGTVVRNAAGVMRAGILPAHFDPLVTGRSDMKLSIGDFRAVQNRGGAIFLANDGVDTTVQLDAAPAANKRIDLIYVTARSTTLGDAGSTPIFGVVKGTVAASPVVPSLPSAAADAIPLATVEIPAGATTTLSAGVVITQVYPYTAMAGGTVVVRNSVELAAWTPAKGARAYCIADGVEYVRAAGGWELPSADTGWVTVSPYSGVTVTQTIERRVRDGIAYVRGQAKTGGGSGSLFQLPAGCRSSTPRRFIQALGTSGASTTVIALGVDGWAVAPLSSTVNIDMVFPADA